MSLQDPALLGPVSERIAARMGLSFPADRWADLARGLDAAAADTDFADGEGLARWIVTHPITNSQVAILAAHLTVGETYFRRDPASFELLEGSVLPALVAARADGSRTIRCWSAGTCSGEEAYSIAISCLRSIPAIATWNVSVLGTDINPRFLAKAQAGAYAAWSFRGVPAWLRDGYCTPAPGGVRMVAPRVRRLVRFARLNLIDDVYPSVHNDTNAMDVILCRNVLMYLTPEHQHRVVAALHGSLVDGGILLVNPAEATPLLASTFVMEAIDGVTVYRRLDARLPAPTGRPASVNMTPARAATAPPAVRPVPGPPTAPTRSTADLLALARAHGDAGRLDAALIACGAAIAADQTNPAAHFLRAMVCSELGRTSEAIEGLRRVLYLEPDSILAHHALGTLFARVGRARDARRHIDAAVALLNGMDRATVVPESDGMTAGQLLDSVAWLAEA